MTWDELVRSADRRTLRRFAVLYLPLGIGLIGFLVWRWSGSLETAGVVWGVGAALAIAAIASGKVARFLYFGLTAITYPIGWVIFHALLALVYFAILSPLGILLKAFGRDTLRLRRPSEAATYWSERPADPPSERYFRQY